MSDGRATSRLPAPTEWTANRTNGWLTATTGMFAFMAACAVAGAVWAFSSGQLLAGSALTYGAIFMFHTAGLSFVMTQVPSRTQPPAVIQLGAGELGVAFRYSYWPYYWLTALLLLTCGALGVFAASAALGASAASLTAAFLLGLLILAAMALIVTFLRMAPGRLTLTTTGIHHQSLTFRHFVPWYAVYDVEAGWINGPTVIIKALPSEDTKLTRHTGLLGTQEAQLLPFVVVRALWMANSPTALYRTAAFYLANPEKRHELASKAAVQRIAAGRL